MHIWKLRNPKICCLHTEELGKLMVECPVQSSRPENMEDSLTQDPESEEQTIQF